MNDGNWSDLVAHLLLEVTIEIKAKRTHQLGKLFIISFATATQLISIEYCYFKV